MYICTAIKAATKERPFITRMAWGELQIKIRPTNTPDCCVISSLSGSDPRRGWQPTAEDLTAKDWITTE